MKILAAAITVLAAAVAFMGVVLLRSDDDHSTEPTAIVSATATRLAAREGVEPQVMEERLRIAEETCDVMKSVGATTVALVCGFNIVKGDAWWDGMPSRQLREVAEVLIEAQR